MDTGDVSQFIITLATDSNALSRLSLELSSKGIPLFELKKNAKTLEEVFLSIISQPMPQELSAKEESK